MKKTLFILIAFAGLLATGCGSNEEKNDKRRYELVTSPYTMNGNTFIGMRVIDTYTGDTWGYTFPHKNADSNWTYIGNPTKLNLK